MPTAKNQLFLWKYKTPSRGYRGYHITGTADGLDSVLSKLSAEQHPLKKSIVVNTELSPVTENELTVPGFAGRARAFLRLNVRVALNDSSNRFRIAEAGECCEITLSGVRLPEFINGLEDIKRGKGDYAMSGDTSDLWFWWHLDD